MVSANPKERIELPLITIVPRDAPCSSRAGSLAAVAAIAIALTSCAGEPAWRGKSLSTWLMQLNGIDHAAITEAELAVKSIGTNALPCLITRLTATPPVFGDALGEKQSEAVLAFRVLGTNAIQSLSTLGSLLTNRVSGATLDPMPIAQSVAGIGKEAVPWLVAGLGDPRPTVRRASLAGLYDLGEKAQAALPAVQQRLQDSDPDTRGLALLFISDVLRDESLKTRLFNAALQDPNPHVRLIAEKELAKLSPK
jgi:hypothetical protein